jgi:hypothetical protein
MLRSLLVDAYEPEIEESVQSAIKQRTQETITILRPLLPSKDSVKAFGDELTNFFDLAAKAWRQVTKLPYRVEASVKGKYPDSFIVRHVTPMQSLTQHEAEHPVAHTRSIVLFPQVVGYGFENPLHLGIILPSKDAISIKAAIEAYQQHLRLQQIGSFKAPKAPQRRLSNPPSNRANAGVANPVGRESRNSAIERVNGPDNI